MKKYLFLALAAGATIGAIFFSALPASAQVSGNFWYPDNNYLRPVISTWGIQLPNLTSESCIGTNSSGQVVAGTCSGGSGSGVATTSLQATSPLTVTKTSSAITYAIPQATASVSGYLSSTDWSTFNNKQGTITLTTNGTSGAATFSSNTLNIPQYEAAGTYLTGLGTGWATTTTSSVTLSTTTQSFNGLTFAQKITRPNTGDLLFTPNVSGTLNNSGLTNSTISGISLGSNLAALTATNGTLTFSGSYNGSAAQTVGLNLGNANTWSAVQTFGAGFVNSATSTGTFGFNISGGCYARNGICLGGGTGTVTSVAETVPSFLSISGSPITTSGTLAIGYSGTALPVANGGTNATSFGTTNGVIAYNGTSLTNYAGYTLTSSLFTAAMASTTQFSAASQKFYVNSAGKITGYDTVHAWSGTLSPTKDWVMGLATSTAWIATTTSPYNLNAQMVLPFTGTLKQAVCNTNAGTLTVEFTIGSTNYYIAGVATKPATTTLSAALNEGAEMSMNAGEPASSPQSVSCTLYATQS